MRGSTDLRLGLSMRVVEATGYVEPRDALAQDWSVFLKRVLPDAHWIPVPNIGKDVSELIEYWGLNGFILTGGNNIHDAPIRDETELTMLEYATRNTLPVLGVCRGMQMICHYYNQSPLPCQNPHNHVATIHRVHLTDNFLQWDEDELTVNSFHEQCVGTGDHFRGELKSFAIADDGLVEGVINAEKTLLGIMWHPERENPASDFDEYLIRTFFSR
ncbi:gamma-glutamyl-gamma-aminobutyrate hydrolase family protein [Methanocalculus natronophilus]|uniref:gamma-glutamyl-gamma-aminobutyrate hydrolase family protein n=1 Tax=Methanocalculus natronophilus TaxID=1262400 RepID=UPI0031B572ED